MSKKITIGITIGDPSGIGPEVVVKSLAQLVPSRHASLFVFGDRAALAASGLRKHRDAFTLIDHAIMRPSQIKFGIVSRDSGAASLAYLKSAVCFLKKGIIDCLVTAPVNKQTIHRTQTSFTGHTEFLARCFRVKRFAMMFVAGDVRASVVTRHIPLACVGASLTRGMIAKTIEMTHEALRKDFKIPRPRLAVLGLNPHASDGGIMGSEEAGIIAPAIRSAAKKIKTKGAISGPLSPDTVFHRVLAKEFDAVICMYHDQALIPFKLLHFFDGVNVTAGLPFVRTSPDHGTAFEIAGKNKADCRSMLAAIQLAHTLARNRLHR